MPDMHHTMRVGHTPCSTMHSKQLEWHLLTAAAAAEDIGAAYVKQHVGTTAALTAQLQQRQLR